jgi:antitoxin component of RelBE/YafQ-DinJ toxin-antitoxin module
MAEAKTNKERVNITVDPHVQRAFAAIVDRQGLSVSGTINTMMDLYAGEAESLPNDNPVVKHLRRVLGGDSRKIEFRTQAGRIAEAAGYEALDIDDSDPLNVRQIPKNMVDAWLGEQGKKKIGLKIVSSLNEQPDVVLGQALMMRGNLNCDIVHIVVPHITGLNENILKTIEQANLSILGVDQLSAAIREKRRLPGGSESDRRAAEIEENLDNQWEERPPKKRRRKIKI